MKILIVGGGVAGPALAQFMKDSAEVTLIDKAPAWGNIGFAIMLWGNGQKILKMLDMEERVVKNGYEVPWTAFENKKGKILTSFSFDIFRRYGPTTVIARSDLQQTLVKNLENSIKIKMGTTVSNITQETDIATATFSDGTTDKFDLIVGADGIRSSVREIVFGKELLKYYNWHVYSFWVPPGMGTPKGVIEFSSNGKMCAIYPMGDRAVVTLFVATKDHSTDRNANNKKILHDLFHDFKDSIDRYIDAVEDNVPIFCDSLANIRMNQWYDRRVVLVGDAQHAISPLMGLGASMALEDAYVLAEELKANMENIPNALQQYEKRRNRRIKKFQKTSRKIEFWLMVKSPILSAIRNTLMKILPISYFTVPVVNLMNEKI